MKKQYGFCRTALLLCAWLFSSAAWAYAFEADGIYYNILSSDDKTVAVTYEYSSGGSYSGKVIIPETVTNEGIEYRVTAIGVLAFRNCESLTEITIPNSVTTIAAMAISGCTSLTSVTIPQSVTTIDYSAFGGCKGLTSVTIPLSVTTIGIGAFYNCSGLTSVTIPSNVTTIGESAFEGCSGLTEFKGKFAVDNCCLIVNDTLIAFAPKCEVTEYVIPDGVTTIGNGAFSGCNGLKSVTIPEGVISIGDDAFVGCSGLKEVWFNADSCINGGFDGCKALTTLHIGKNVKSIPSRAFSYCTSLEKFEGKFASDNGRCLIVNDTLIAFAPSGLTEYSIPESVTAIGKYAFVGCSGLISVTIPEGITTIGNGAFAGCEGLTSVTIGNGVTTIGKSAFNGCSGLTSVTIPNSVTAIGEAAFSGCNGLKSVTISDGVTSIDEWAFYDCTGLTSVTIPKSVVSIGDCAFRSCTGLKSLIVYNPTPAYIGGVYSPAFDGLDCANCTLYVPAESVELYKVVEGWKEFGEILPIDESSAITEIRQDNADGHVTVYNLQGVLVLETDDAADLKTLQNGAYIVNGKKMIIVR